MSRESDYKNKINRRDFIKFGAAGAAAIGVACSGGGSEKIVPSAKLGRTNLVTSRLAFGGGSALSMVEKDDDAYALLDLARRLGINVFDTGSEYDKGRSETRYGIAFKDYRKDLYFSSKYGVDYGPDKVMEKFETTLKRLNTDYLDIAHMHAVGSIDGINDVETMFSSKSLETLIKLKEQGVLRTIGLTSHNHPPAVVEAIRRYDFDIVFIAANASKVPFHGEFEEVGDGSFEELSLPVAREKNMGIYSFKMTGQRRLIAKNNEPDKANGEELIRYGLSLPVHGIILGMSTQEHLRNACELAANAKPLSKEEMQELNARLAPNANSLTLQYLDSDYVDHGGWRSHLA